MKNCLCSFGKYGIAMFVFSCLLVTTTYAQDPSSILDLESNTKGVLVPRMNTADRIALPGINTPAEGLLVYDTETNSFWYYDEGVWNELDGKEVIMPDGDKSTTTPKPIPDLETINDTITLAGAGTIEPSTRIKVCVDITHPWVSDLDVSLVAPDGTTILDLSSDNGGSGDHYRNTCFTTEATVPITAGSPPFTGEFIPETPLLNLIGQSIAGDWVLMIYDDVNVDAGTLNSWSIEIDYDEEIMTKGMSDHDGDTKVVVEEFADDDHVRLFADGAEMMKVSKGTGVALGAIDDGYPGDSVQLNLSGAFNTGTNNGSANGTYKLRIEAYQNDGQTVYPIYVIDENYQVDYYLKNRPSLGGSPSMYFAGNMAIGQDKYATGYRLSVDGKIACEEVLVDLDADWPDYVFTPEYQLRSLADLRAHIQEKGHLPGVPSAVDIEKEGLVLGEMNRILMEKVEELTLYILQQDEELKKKDELLEDIQKRLEALESEK